MQDSTQERAVWARILQRTIKPFLIVIVVLGIGQSIRLAWEDLRTTQSRAKDRILSLQQRRIHVSTDEQAAIDLEISEIENRQFSLHRLRWDIAIWSIAFSALALLPPVIYWWLTLINFEHSIPFLSTLSIYSAGNLGKYVPGKAMVLVLRSGGMQKHGVPIATSIVSIFIETLTSLSVGGAVGAFTLAALNPPPWLMATALGAAILCLAPTIPPIFRRVLVVLTRYRHLRLPPMLTTAMSWRLVLCGWILFILVWLLMGSSLWILCEAIRQSTDLVPTATEAVTLTSAKLWWICVAASCLGFVIGFLSMLPGGAGVREVVVTMLLAPAIGYAPALAAAVLYRISTLVAELFVAGLAWCLAKKSVDIQLHQTRSK